MLIYQIFIKNSYLLKSIIEACICIMYRASNLFGYLITIIYTIHDHLFETIHVHESEGTHGSETAEDLARIKLFEER